jgi:hypothetical protein
MFPNVRLMIVAISASLLAIVCAMGMFAAFSVTHELFSALPAGKLPLQIAFGDESSAPVVDGKPAPFGVRFQLNAPQAPSGPVIVMVPAALDRVPPPGAAAAAEPAPGPAPESESTAAPSQDEATAQPPSPDAQMADSVQATKTGDVKANEAKADGVDKDDVTAAIKAPSELPVSERPAVQSAPQRVAQEIRIVAREAENPASVNTSPAPTLAHKAIKRRKLAARLHQLHHFRRPHIHATAAVANQTPTYVQPNGFAQPNGFVQPNAYSQPSAFAQPNGFAQPGFQYAPAAIKPKPVKFRRSARNQ